MYNHYQLDLCDVEKAVLSAGGKKGRVPTKNNTPVLLQASKILPTFSLLWVTYLSHGAVSEIFSVGWKEERKQENKTREKCETDEGCKNLRPLTHLLFKHAK